MPVVRIGQVSSLGAISGFTGSISKIVIDDTQVYPGSQAIEIVADKTFNIKVTCSVTPLGDIAWNDVWTVGVTAKMGTQFGWDPTHPTGGGTNTGTRSIGNLKGPTSDSMLDIKLYAIDDANPPAPPG